MNVQGASDGLGQLRESVSGSVVLHFGSSQLHLSLVPALWVPDDVIWVQPNSTLSLSRPHISGFLLWCHPLVLPESRNAGELTSQEGILEQGNWEPEDNSSPLLTSVGCSQDSLFNFLGM